VSSDESRDDTSPDSSDNENPARPEEPTKVDQPDSAEHGEATPYEGYGSPGVHPIPSPQEPPPGPRRPAEPEPPPVPGSPGEPGPSPADVTGPAPSQTYPGPPYPGETYPVYPPGQPIYPGQRAYPSAQPGYPLGQPAYPGYPGAVAPTARPGQVNAGIVMSWVGGGVFVMFGLLLFALAGNDDLLDGVEQQLDQQLNRDQATTIFRTLGVGLGIWGIAVIVFAALAWNGRNWARIVLTAMGGCYCASQLVGIASGAVAGLLFLAYVVIAVGLLWTRAARSWYATRAYDGSGEPKPPPIVW
jgi:hypothetical protein